MVQVGSVLVFLSSQKRSRELALQVAPVNASSLRLKSKSPLPVPAFSCSQSPEERPGSSGAMSKSSTLKVKRLFKIKSSGKESKEPKRSDSFPDEAATSPRDRADTLPASPDTYSLGPDATLDRDLFPAAAKEKKGKRLLSFRLKRRKSKHKEGEVGGGEGGGGDVFFPDDLGRFNRQL